MKKFWLVFSLSLLFFFSSFNSVSASLVKINSRGEVIWQVLSAEDPLTLAVARNEDIEVKNVSLEEGGESISLKKKEDKLYLNDLEVTDWQDDLVEVEERGAAKKIIIGTEGDRFTIEQEGIVALTSFPINIRPQENEFSVTTSSGSVFLAILPLEAAESALRSRFMTKIVEKRLELSEYSQGGLVYRISGQKVINLLNLISFEIPVTTQVSASTGEILSLEGPEWFKVFNFLFA